MFRVTSWVWMTSVLTTSFSLSFNTGGTIVGNFLPMPVLLSPVRTDSFGTLILAMGAVRRGGSGGWFFGMVRGCVLAVDGLLVGVVLRPVGGAMTGCFAGGRVAGFSMASFFASLAESTAISCSRRNTMGSV